MSKPEKTYLIFYAPTFEVIGAVVARGVQEATGKAAGVLRPATPIYVGKATDEDSRLTASMVE